MTNLFKYTLLIFLLSFSACSSEDYVAPTVPNGQPQPGDVLELTVSAADFVTDGASDTRVTDNGNETTFENGDRVGIIILDKRNVPIYNNIPYKYNGGKWVFDSNNGEGKGACYYDPEATTYIVYYPYSQTADGVTNENDLKSKFAPKLDQSAKENYRASDLMYCKTTSGTPFKRLEAKLKHAYASVSFAPTAYRLDDEKNTRCNIKVSDVSLTIGDNVYIPYKTTDGSLRSILPASFTTGSIRCFYVFGGKNCGNTINITVVRANTRYTFAPEIINKTYSLQDAKVGDFYCKRSNDNNGYLIPSDFALTNDQKNACVGIVMKVGKDDSGNWIDDCSYKFKGSNKAMSIIHGYVLALYDANDGNRFRWGRSVSVGTNTEQTTGFYGYKNTQTIIDYNNNEGLNLQTYFPATYYATEYYENKYSAPNNSSGWFLPSAGQGQYWLNNQTTLLPQVKKATGNYSYNWKSWYWSSSEASYAPDSDACCMEFYTNYVTTFYKYINYYATVRSCLAF